jgi:hypothetical protein
MPASTSLVAAHANDVAGAVGLVERCREPWIGIAGASIAVIAARCRLRGGSLRVGSPEVADGFVGTRGAAPSRAPDGRAAAHRLGGHDVAPLVATLASVIAGSIVALAVAVAATGFTVVLPNQYRVVVLFGRYIGTLRRDGFFWVVPLTSRTAVSLRVRFFDTDVLKVNDARGKPGRDLRGDQLAGDRHRQGQLRRRRLRELREDPGGDGDPARRQRLSLRRLRGRAVLLAGERRPG